MNKDWLDIGVLEDYLDGKLDAKTMNRVEREALEDPFVAEALAGLSESPKRALQSMSLLQKQLHERVAEHQRIKKTSVITWQRLSIGTAAAVMFVAVSIMFWMRESNHQKELAGRSKNVDVTIAPVVPVVEPPAAIQAAPGLASESADQVVEKEMDKAVKAAKTNTYAARGKSKTEVAIPQSAPQQLNDVVVVGYGVQRKQNIVGAVASVATLDVANVMSGKVTAQDDGKPLIGAIVRVDGTNLTAVTDTNGEFKINADTSIKEGKILVNSIGFKATELLAKANQPINVTLVPDRLALNEVVVVAYGKAEKKVQALDSHKVNNALAERVGGVRIRGTSTMQGKVAMVSNPVGGWDKLWAYIGLNNAFKDEVKAGQVVEVSFKINKEGTPTDLKIEKEADDKYEQEAIRLIINGPKWERPEKRNSRMTFRIDF
ncbi:carboxypeptidase-like regulatory domain-containing protein [Pedobacter nyackensis]|uniref:carboxypeptidase-like regulatory domain-containing protein n=1 Tax=Pedobacter nyackensis TaxID=475255 RepID=UPI00292F906B|nr:carboxypeptidase-like regulatory domain-containing protein [Pedobacter nyackensis]